ncbi:hypothetical protein, partial [Streptomyces lunaelactis]|uniref:hypothetical protein n=1 Tax=Streptomyces lunaelactis TaxID=1535768 RepID=UPI0026745C19
MLGIGPGPGAGRRSATGAGRPPPGGGAARPADTTVGDVTGFAHDGPVYRLTAGNAVARVSFV